MIGFSSRAVSSILFCGVLAAAGCVAEDLDDLGDELEDRSYDGDGDGDGDGGHHDGVTVPHDQSGDAAVDSGAKYTKYNPYSYY